MWIGALLLSIPILALTMWGIQVLSPYKAFSYVVGAYIVFTCIRIILENPTKK